MKRRNFLKWCLTLPVLPTSVYATGGLLPISKNDYIPATTFNYDNIYISPEALEDIRNWGCDIIDETTRKELSQQYV